MGPRRVPAELKQEDWAYLGVNVSMDFEPVYIIPPKKAQQVKKLKAALKDAKDLYLATDEDREGEAISWHLCEVLKPKVPVHRLVFHEITEEAIREALKQPRAIDRPWCERRKCGGSSTGFTATTSHRLFGGKSGRSYPPAACRAWRCG